MKQVIELSVNGEIFEAAVEPYRTLADCLREDLGLTGTKQGCGEGDCGACAVLLDSVPVNSCIVLAMEAVGREVRTIEGMANGNVLHPVQDAFIEVGAVQCGFCTPGMVLTATAFLQKNPAPTTQQVRHAISGNLCRCTGYQKIVDAVMDASDRLAVPDAGEEVPS